MNWFLDFDDTLALGPLTWAIQTVLPDLIQKNALSYDAAKLDSLVLDTQRDSVQGAKDTDMLDTVFQAMGWPDSLKANLLEKVFDQYTPTLFSDTLPFLQRMSAAGQALYILSNNNHAPQIAKGLGIAQYLTDIFTPKTFALERGKPHPEIWTCISKNCDVGNAILVGDDPWSDGAFSDACGIRCYIVDRLNRLEMISSVYKRVQSLDEITVQSALSHVKN